MRQEEDEKWKRLSCASADSHVASSLWNKLMSPPKEPAKLVNMERSTYLSALTPGELHFLFSLQRTLHSYVSVLHEITFLGIFCETKKYCCGAGIIETQALLIGHC